MKPIENIFGFDCGTCEYNRHCYGGDMGNQFRYCQKSTEKIQNLENLQQENQQLKNDINKLQKELNEENLQCSKYTIEINDLKEKNQRLKEDIKNIIKILEKNCDELEATEEEFDSLDRWQGLQTVELEQGSDSND